MPSKRPIALLAGLLLYLPPLHGVGATWYVTPDGQGDAPTIQAAMDSATAGDTVLVASGSYTWTSQGASAESMVQMKDGVHLRGESGPAQTLLDAENRGRVIHSQGAGPASISGLTIAGGFVYDDGGGILSGYGLILSDCIIRDNRAGSGGGLACYAGASRVDRCQFLRNTADVGVGGGAISENTNFSRSTFYDNSCLGGTGGALFMFSSPGFPSTSLKDCWFEANMATFSSSASWGGAVSADGDSVLRCMFVANSAENGSALSGGGHVEDCVFIANRSSTGPTIVSTFQGRLEGCTVVYNRSSSPSFASAVRLHQTVVVANSLIAFNEGSACNGSGTFVCSDLFGNTQSDLLCGVDGGGNINADPQFCTADPVISLDVSLRSSSPCLPENNSCRVLMGATGSGCTTASVPQGPGEASRIELPFGTRPNPFKSNTWINYSTTSTGHVHLMIYDLRGRSVRALVDAGQGPGDHLVLWDGLDEGRRLLPSGVYVARIVSGGHVATQKLILAR